MAKVPDIATPVNTSTEFFRMFSPRGESSDEASPARGRDRSTTTASPADLRSSQSFFDAFLSKKSPPKGPNGVVPAKRPNRARSATSVKDVRKSPRGAKVGTKGRKGRKGRRSKRGSMRRRSMRKAPQFGAKGRAQSAAFEPARSVDPDVAAMVEAKKRAVEQQQERVRGNRPAGDPDDGASPDPKLTAQERFWAAMMKKEEGTQAEGDAPASKGSTVSQSMNVVSLDSSAARGNRARASSSSSKPNSASSDSEDSDDSDVTPSGSRRRRGSRVAVKVAHLLTSDNDDDDDDDDDDNDDDEGSDSGEGESGEDSSSYSTSVDDTQSAATASSNDASPITPAPGAMARGLASSPADSSMSVDDDLRLLALGARAIGKFRLALESESDMDDVSSDVDGGGVSPPRRPKQAVAPGPAASLATEEPPTTPVVSAPSAPDATASVALEVQALRAQVEELQSEVARLRGVECKLQQLEEQHTSLEETLMGLMTQLQARKVI